MYWLYFCVKQCLLNIFLLVFYVNLSKFLFFGRQLSFAFRSLDFHTLSTVMRECSLSPRFRGSAPWASTISEKLSSFSYHTRSPCWSFYNSWGWEQEVERHKCRDPVCLSFCCSGDQPPKRL